MTSSWSPALPPARGFVFLSAFLVGVTSLFPSLSCSETSSPSVAPRSILWLDTSSTLSFSMFSAGFSATVGSAVGSFIRSPVWLELCVAPSDRMLLRSSCCSFASAVSALLSAGLDLFAGLAGSWWAGFWPLLLRLLPFPFFPFAELSPGTSTKVKPPLPNEGHHLAPFPSWETNG